MPGMLGSSARTETRSRRLATVTLLTFAQATVGLSALAQLPPPMVSLFLLLRPVAHRDAVPLRFTSFLIAGCLGGRSTAPQKAGIKRCGRKVAHDRASFFAFLA